MRDAVSVLTAEQETRRHLKKDPSRPGYWLLTEPHLLYLTKEQSAAYLQAMGNPDYASHFHTPTVEIIEKSKSEIFGGVAGPVSLIDLGPGYPDKTLPVAKYLRAAGIEVFYVPVDISSEYLAIAAEATRPHVTEVHPCRARFEDLPAALPQLAGENTRICFIGLTFMNFPPQIILPVLQKTTAENGVAVVASELFTPTNTVERILEGYRSRDIWNFAIGPLRNLGLADGSSDYQVNFHKSRVEMGFRLRSDVPDLGLGKGDTILTAISYRYAESEIGPLLGQYFGQVSTYFSPDRATVLAGCRTLGGRRTAKTP